jgi:signal transduction histidine kinase
MRLGKFILQDMETILARWEAFAATRLPAASHMAPLELRDHAQQILEAVAADLATTQTPEAQTAKSMGLAPAVTGAPETAAQTHAILRAKSGFNIEQLASEYRALRASVMSLWIETWPPGPWFLDDVIRFNEAIDQALAESIGFFSAHVTRTRNLLLGMLSHDLRSPLQTIRMTGQYLQQLDSSADIGQAATRLIKSGARMQKLLDDIMDLNRTELGVGIRVIPAEVELGAVCADELDRIRVAHPGQDVELQVVGDCRGFWDTGRIQQLLNNLVVNAIQYGEQGGTIRVTLRGENSEVVLSVTNSGQPIDAQTLAQIFEPLRRGREHARMNDAGLGLGLYIANEIAKAHGGRILAKSEVTQTVFAVRLPRDGRPTTGQSAAPYRLVASRSL